MWGQMVALMATRGWQMVSERLQLKGFTETKIGALVTRLISSAESAVTFLVESFLDLLVDGLAFVSVGWVVREIKQIKQYERRVRQT